MIDRPEKHQILYRPVGLQELALIYDSGMQSFPAHLPQQPIFYPVFQLAYARKTASDWNAEKGEFAGYVTQFKMQEEYIRGFEEHTVQGTQYQELWIPAEELEEFNKHIVGHIKLLEAHFGETFQGFIPDSFALQGKNAVDQFTTLANSYLYKRMDFFLEIKRNHKAVFLNFLFWQKYEFKNPGLKEKILQAIKEAWFASFPKTPLPNPIVEEAASASESDGSSGTGQDEEDLTPTGEIPSPPVVRPVQREIKPVKQSYSDSLVKPIHRARPPVEKPADPPVLVNAVQEEPAVIPAQADPSFLQGIQLGLSGRYHEAIEELTRAVEANPGQAVAHTSLGVALQRVGENDRALECYETALRIDPLHAEAHYFRANILYGLGNVREAIAGYTVAVGLKPELIAAHEGPLPEDHLTEYTPSLAEMNWIVRPAQRILALNRSLESNPKQARLFKERAAAYERLRNYVQAIADYSSLLELEPDDANVLHARGLAYEQLGQPDRALKDFERAVAIDPQLSNVFIDRGIAFGKAGNYRQAVASFTESIRLAPQNPDGYFNRGTTYLQQGDLESAIDDFSNVIRLSADDETAYYRRGIAHEESGKARQAIDDYKKFLELSQDPQARAEIEQRLSQWQEATPEGPSSDRQNTDVNAERQLDLYDLIAALGGRAVNSTWFGHGVTCQGEAAQELYAFTEHDKPIEGRDLLSITSRIQQTRRGDFYAVDPGAESHWLFIRAWDGNGFYIETDDADIAKRLTTHFRSIQEVEGASPPYQSMFIDI